MSEFVIEDSNFDNAKTLRKLIAYMNSLTLAYWRRSYITLTHIMYACLSETNTNILEC